MFLFLRKRNNPSEAQRAKGGIINLIPIAKKEISSFAKATEDTVPLTKEQKQKIIGELKEKIDKQKSIVFADFTKMKVKDLSSLRKKIKQDDGELKVAKKTLISLALKEKNIEFNAKQLGGEIAMGFGYKDEVAPFRVLYDFSKGNENLKILGGLISGEFYDKNMAIAIAQMPSREEIIAQLFYSANYSLFGIFDSLQRNLSVLKSKV